MNGRKTSIHLDTDGRIVGITAKEQAPSGAALPYDYNARFTVTQEANDMSGLRYNSGKAPLEMIPLHLLEGAARVFHDVTTREVNPYPKWNWLKENDWSVPYACMMRHLSKWQMGEDNDPETGRSHLHHAMCNLLMLTHYAEQYPNRDDRPK